jgi:soluble lytic murein transglycosylase-like protein
MTAATPAASADLRTLVHAGRWEEVCTVVAARPAPLAANVALVAAIAETHMGHPRRALALLDDALPGAGELGPALRLEASEVAVTLGRDPWSYLEPLLRRDAPSAQRRMATTLVRHAWQTLPLESVATYRHRRLNRALRRELDAILSMRTGDRAKASSLLRERNDDRAALEIARWLEPQEGLAPSVRLDAATALLAQGWWREADAELATIPLPPTQDERLRLTYLRARAAYRLGRFAEAGEGYEHALAIATDRVDRFDAAVQRARVGELLADWPKALAFWQTARTAAPREVEGWDGTTRLLAALGRGEEAVTLLRQAPLSARKVFGPRLVAILLARGEATLAASALRRVPAGVPAALAMHVALAAAQGDRAAARAAAANLLADQRAGPWRELALAMLPGAEREDPVASEPTRDPDRLAELAVRLGPAAARQALEAALAFDSQWAPLVGDEPLDLPPLAPPLAALVEVGLESTAAGVLSHLFPAASPAELAWSARYLAMWGNRSEALAYGERIWDRLEVPAVLLPDALLPRLIPEELVSECTSAAREASFRADWLAAIVRRESRFRTRASSAAGALGIAQLVPETTRRLGAEPEDALNPATGLTLAAGEAHRLAELFQQRLVPLAAAYNAGEPIVTAWLHEMGENATEPLLAAAIPYGETSRYVLAVVEGAALCRHLRPTSRAAARAASP